MIQKDIIYGNIELDGIYEEIIKSEEFLRLKDITQTAMSTIQYPELSQETRYEHSIGVYYLMCRTLNNLERKLSRYGLHISKEEKVVAKLAALLHDIGHGVHSHLLEKITGVSHEQRGIDIIKDPTTQIHQIIVKQYGEEFVEKLVEFMECIYGNGEILEGAELREDNTVPLKVLLASLISHNIDLDRMDYLLRESTYTGLGTLTNYQELIDSFECVLAGNQIILGIPQEKQHILEANILERTRNYREIYYSDMDFLGNHAFEELLLELRKHPEEVPAEVSEGIRKFLTQEKANLTNQEYMQLTNGPLDKAIDLIASQTQSDKIRYLCHYKEKAKKDYHILYNVRNEEYIRNLLRKIIPGFSEDSHCIFSETKDIKPYKKTKFGSTNIITKAGIQNFENLPHGVNLEPIQKSIIAINPELLRLELGIPEQEFKAKYADILKDIINSQSKPVQEFELKYVLMDEKIYGEDILDKLREKYRVIDSATYAATDYYYDSLESFSLLENGEILRIRNGVTYYQGELAREYKNRRITYKTYEEDGETTYTNREKQEEIGNGLQLQDYTEFLSSIGMDEELFQSLIANSYRRLFTFMVNEQPIDISFNVTNFQNCIYEMPGQVRTIEIRPRDNQIIGRILLLQIKKELEEAFPELQNLVSNANIYEIGMVTSYDRYKKGYIISEDAQEFEEKHPEIAEKLASIVEELKEKRNMTYVTRVPKAEDFMQQNQLEER